MLKRTASVSTQSVEELGEYPGIKGSPSWYNSELHWYTSGSYTEVRTC